MPAFAIVLMIALAGFLGGKRRFGTWPWRIVLGSLFLQLVIIFFLTPDSLAFEAIKKIFEGVSDCAMEGAKSVFGQNAPVRSVLALSSIAMLVSMSAVMAVLYYYGLPQIFIKAMTACFRKTMGIGGLDATLAAVNVFFGLGETCTLSAPYISGMSSFTFMVMIVTGFATISISMIPFYQSVGIVAGDLVAASVMSAPAALLYAALLCPDKIEASAYDDVSNLDMSVLVGDSPLDSFSKGAMTGLKVAVGIIVSLLATIAAVALFNLVFAWPGHFIPALSGLTFQKLLAYPGAIWAFLMGVPAGEAMEAGYILGLKVLMNEAVAYTELVKLQEVLSPRTVRIVTFACCDFANLCSVTIVYGIIGTIAPKRCKDLGRLLPRAFLAGVMASSTNACLAALF